jgi:SAM-dependent methyltransferase
VEALTIQPPSDAASAMQGCDPGEASVKHAALIATACAASAAAWWWTDSAPYPYALHKLLDLPLPFLTNRRLDAMLSPPGERVLEVGPGTGLQALHVAGLLGARGRLDIVDVQQPMLDYVERRAAARNISSIFPERADARELRLTTAASTPPTS